MEVGVQAVRQQLGEILDRVDTGETVVVTRRGARVAAIVPAPKAGQPLGVAAYAGSLARMPGLGEAVATVVSLRSVARDREPPEMG